MLLTCPIEWTDQIGKLAPAHGSSAIATIKCAISITDETTLTELHSVDTAYAGGGGGGGGGEGEGGGGSASAAAGAAAA